MRAFVSIDCVIFGFDGLQLNVLLVRRQTISEEDSSLKLPGSLIYQQENADDAAQRVLFELTGIKKMPLRQFKCFTSAQRAAKPSDKIWLEFEYHSRVERLITIAYLALCKIDRKLNMVSQYKSVEWMPIDALPQMPFDHNQIVSEALGEIRAWGGYDPSILYELLPAKFTASELRRLYEAIYYKSCDVRNFHKKMLAMEYVIPLDEKEKGVAHRAARLYKFDRVLYRKRKMTI